MLFKIGEFSKITRMSIRMLRYYDELGLLQPVFVEQQSGYRYYDAAQIAQVQKVVFLRDIGFSVNEIIELLPFWGQDGFQPALERRRAEIQAGIAAEEARLGRVERAIAEVGSLGAVQYNFAIKSVPEMRVFSLRRVIASYFNEGALWYELYQYMHEHEIVPVAGQLHLAIYHDEEYREQDVDVEVCALVARNGVGAGEFCFRTIAAMPMVASAMIYGPFENIAAGYLDFAAWLGEHAEYRMGKTSRQIVHRGPWNEERPEKYLTEIQIPVDRR